MEFAQQVFASCIGALMAYIAIQMYQAHMLQRAKTARELFSEYVDTM